MPQTWASKTSLPLGTRPPGTPLGSPLAGTIRIMGLGDSITYGFGTTANTANPLNDAWRRDLYNLLTDPERGNLPVEFIGPQSNTSGNTSTDPSRLSRGVVGRSAQDHQADIATVIGAGNPYRPHVIIVLLGLNDAQRPTESAAFADSLDTLVDTCAALEPTARFVVCSAPDGLGGANRTRLHAEVWPGWVTACSTLTAAGVPFVPCDLRTLLWGPDHILSEAPNYVHPVPRGYRKIADALYPAVMNACGYEARW